MSGRLFHSQGGLYFQQVEGGHVRIVKSEGGPPLGDNSNVVFDTTVNDGIWGSAVLTMSGFNERPGDWQKFMGHHHGRRDMLAVDELRRLRALNEDKFRTIQAYCKAASEDKARIAELEHLVDALDSEIESAMKILCLDTSAYTLQELCAEVSADIDIMKADLAKRSDRADQAEADNAALRDRLEKCIVCETHDEAATCTDCCVDADSADDIEHKADCILAKNPGSAIMERATKMEEALRDCVDAIEGRYDNQSSVDGFQRWIDACLAAVAKAKEALK